MTLDQIRQSLQDRRLTVVARHTRIAYNTIREIRDNPDANPKWNTICTLSDYLEGSQ